MSEFDDLLRRARRKKALERNPVYVKEQMMKKSLRLIATPERVRQIRNLRKTVPAEKSSKCKKCGEPIKEGKLWLCSSCFNLEQEHPTEKSGGVT
jgi:hypothetical protein